MSASGDAIFNSDVVMGSTGKLRSDGDVDSYLQFNQANVLRAVIGDSTRMIISTGETVFNEDSGDFDFRVESDNATHALFVQGSDGKVGIGESSPSARLEIGGMAAGEQALLIESGRNDALSNGLARINITDANCPFAGLQIDHAGTGAAIIANNNVLVGKTSADASVRGCELRPEGLGIFTNTNSYSSQNRRYGSDGEIIELRRDSNSIGAIGVLSTNNLTISGTVGDHGGLQFGTHCVLPMEANSDSNGTIDLGGSGSKFKDGYFSGNLYGDGSNLTGVGGSTTLAAVGTYAFIYNDTGDNSMSPGSTKAGSTSGFVYGNGDGPGSTKPSGGTWRAMGHPQYFKSTLWLRIA